MPTLDQKLALLGRSVRRVRQDRDLSQEALAFRAGVHPNQVGRLERGTNTRLTTFLSVIDGLGVSLSELAQDYEQRLPRADR